MKLFMFLMGMPQGRHQAPPRHAAAHEAAAKCLEAGNPEKDCLEKLRQDCKGLGIGKYCGMRHQH
jgi:hypothetical protein